MSHPHHTDGQPTMIGQRVRNLWTDDTGTIVGIKAERVQVELENGAGRIWAHPSWLEQIGPAVRPARTRPLVSAA